MSLSLSGISLPLPAFELRVDMTAERGRLVSILGPSGCGKTTTLRLIAGFLRPERGRILLRGEDATYFPPWKRGLGVVFQDYALFPHLSVGENIAYGLRVRRSPDALVRSRVAEMCGLVRLQGLEKRRVHELSGGERQRVALARALAAAPDIVLLDEPLNSVDAALRASIRSEIRAVQRALGTTMVYVTHDQSEALSISDKIVCLREGRVIQEGAPELVYRHPVDAATAAFLGESNFLDGVVEEAIVELLPAAGPGPAGAILHRVRTEYDVFHALALEKLQPETKVVLFFRPESVRLPGRLGAGSIPGLPARGSTSNRLRGKVVDLAFLGPVFRVGIETKSGRIQASLTDETPAPIGSNMDVSVEAHDCLLYRR